MPVAAARGLVYRHPMPLRAVTASSLTATWLIGSVLLVASCAGEEYAVAPVRLGVTEPGLDDDASGETDPETTDLGPTPGAGSDGDDGVMVEDAGGTDPAPDVGSPVDTASNAPDVGPPEDTGWVPEWVEDADPAIKGCLEAFPAICDKVAECGEEQPLLGLVSGFCPGLFDSLSPILATGCEQLGGILEESLPGDIPLVGDLSDLIPKLIKGCIENFQCDPEYLQEFGAALQGIVALFQGQDGEQADFSAALPALLELADKCGGLDEFFPFDDLFGAR